VSADTLRIVSFRWEPYALPFAQPFATAGGRLEERRGFLVRLQDDRGAWSVGEAAPLPDFGGETLSACEAQLRRWEEELPGCAMELEPRPALPAPAFGLLPAPITSPTAVHALESALLDLAARRAGLTLARWLHPAAPLQVAVNATLGATEASAAAAAARDAVAQGFRTLKLKVGVGGAAADEARLRAVREAVGSGVRLRIDANGAWSREEALALLERWVPLGLEYAEQPVSPADPEALAWLVMRSPVPIAADESIRAPADAERLLRQRAASLLVLKPMLLGGPLTTLRIARASLAARVPVVVTTVLEGIYGRLAALHVAAAVAALHAESGLEAPPPACGLATGALLVRDHVPQPPVPLGGVWYVPSGPGLGLA